MSTPTILIVEDEPDMVRGLSDALRFEGYEVLSAQCGAEGIELAGTRHPDLVLLDLMLPDLNGYVVCQRVRALDPRVPIIMLTARSQEADKIRGFEAGADDYVSKPFSIGELLARIKAMFRRVARTTGVCAPSVVIGAATIDFQKQTLERAGVDESLTFYEVELLRLLFERLEEPVSREEILEKVWGTQASPSNRTVDNFIVRLRRRIEDDSKSPRHILTVYGHGYKLVL